MTQQADRFASPLRYPGGKGVLVDFLKLVIDRNNLYGGHYVELYAGGSAVALELLFEEYVRFIHINDINEELVAFWRSVLQETEAFCRLIRDTDVTIDEWDRQKAIYSNPTNHTQLEVGFSTFFLNRTNRSGILNGGIIGGRNQNSAWRIDARYNKQTLTARIQRIARYAGHIHIHNVDAAQFIRNELPHLPIRTLLYLDPPYFHKGQQLYENHYDPDAHAEIAQLTNLIQQPWLVSYDNCPEIQALYGDYRRIEYSLRYSVRDRYEGSEVIFFSNNLNVPAVTTPISIKPQDYTQPLL